MGRAAPSGSGGRPAPSAAARPGSPPAGASAGARSASRSAGSARVPLAATGPVRRERRLRRTVAELGSCLDALPVLERRVLVLRSGLGARSPRSRAGVGRALDLSLRRVGQLERRGLRRLRGLAGGGPCQGAPTQVAGDADAPAPAWDAPAMLSAARGPFAAPRSQDRIEVKGEQKSSGSGREEVPAELEPPRSAAPPSAAVVPRPGDGGTDVTFILIALAALLGIALAVRDTRHAG